MAEGIALDKDQAAVVASDSRAMVVSAAAGAGKTRVLTERYLSQVRKGVPPDRILTITFTRKAAAEMKQRIVARLRDEGLMAEAQVAETGPIQTIHSFCERTLRENAVEAGLDPEFDIAADGEGAQFAREAVRNTLTWLLDESPDAHWLVERMAEARGSERLEVYEALLAVVAGLVESLRSKGLDVDEVERVHADPEGLQALWESVALDSLHPAWRERFDELDPTMPFRQRVLEAVKLRLEGVPRVSWPRAQGDVAQAAQESCALAKLAVEAWRALDAQMQRSQELDFAALELRAIRLLETSQEARRKLGERYRCVLVDEAQDMNPLQHRLVRSLDPESLMLVGDTQQSIYGFRYAEPQLFEALQDELQAHRLATNYRSREGILAFVDEVFKQIQQPGYVPMWRSNGDPLAQPPPYDGVEFWRTKAFDPAQTAKWVAELVGEGLTPADIAVLTHTNRECAAIETALKDIAMPCQVIGGAEQFYARLEVRDLANAMRILADPYDDFAMVAVLRGPAVELSMDSIALLAMKGEVFEALEEFEPPVPEDNDRIREFLGWYEPLRSHADRLPAWEALSEFLARSPYLVRLANRAGWRQALMNTRKLVAIASREAHLGPLEFAERIREVQRISHREGNAPIFDEQAPTIKIMTIHKAKGLEFKAVVLPTFYRERKQPRDLALLEETRGLIVSNLDRRPAYMADFVKQSLLDQEDAERRRVLYVAMTRAKERLCFCGDRGAKTGTLAQKVVSAMTPRSSHGAETSGLRFRDP
ncbi:MAG: hypothetical protein AMXMBFR81_12420 [Chthonomonas sp.]